MGLELWGQKRIPGYQELSEQERMDRVTPTSNYQCSLGGQRSLNWSGVTFVGAPRLVALLEDCVDAPRESLRVVGRFLVHRDSSLFHDWVP